MSISIKALFCAAAVVLAGGVQAQERAAAGATDTQMTWSALSSQISALSTKTDGVITNVNQITTCGKLGMVYAPGVGCIEAGKTGDITTNISKLSTTLTTLTNNLNSLTTSLNTTNSKVTNIIACATAGQTFNGTKCATTDPLGSRTLAGYNFGITANNTSGAAGYGLPAGTTTVLLNTKCEAKGSLSIVTLTATFPGTSYPASTLCALNGVSDSDTNMFGVSQVINVPVGASQININYSTVHSLAASPETVTIYALGH